MSRPARTTFHPVSTRAIPLDTVLTVELDGTTYTFTTATDWPSYPYSAKERSFMVCRNTGGTYGKTIHACHLDGPDAWKLAPRLARAAAVKYRCGFSHTDNWANRGLYTIGTGQWLGQDRTVLLRGIDGTPMTQPGDFTSARGEGDDTDLGDLRGPTYTQERDHNVWLMAQDSVDRLDAEIAKLKLQRDAHAATAAALRASVLS